MAVASSVSALPAADASQDRFAALADEYPAEIRPLLQQFCLECHSTLVKAGELDLERFATLADVRRGTKAWQKVVEMLDNGEMPPEDAEPQPSAAQRKQLRDWAERYLNAEALANAGDPGPVVLRRLNNAQYTYTIRDLTGVTLSPAGEFPVDGAAGEGFTNTGSALVMSPSLLRKYLEAGKDVAGHAVLLPDGFRFSPSDTRRDWTNEALARIRAFYQKFTDSSGGTQVNLQGVKFETNAGGRLEVEKYLAATLAEREAVRDGKSIEEVAREYHLNAKYLGILWEALNARESSLLLDVVRARWREADVEEAASLAAEIAVWQSSLFRFSSVGHIVDHVGRGGGYAAWQEPVTPLTSRQEVRLKLPDDPKNKEVVLYLVAADAGDGHEQDFVVWERPRIVAPGRPDLLLRDVRAFTRDMNARRDRIFASTAQALRAAAQAGRASRTGKAIDVAALAKRHDVDPEALTAWLEYLGIGSHAPIKLDHFTNKLTSAGEYDFVQGWGSSGTPSLHANSSDEMVHIPGNMKPHGVGVHPSPTEYAAIGWRSPITGLLRIEGQVTDAHPACGNGVTWSLELRRGGTRQRLATGTAQGAGPVRIGPIENLAVQPGDLVSLLIGPRDGNHSCDFTDVELVLESGGEKPRRWDLTGAVADDVLAGNPQADRFGHEDVWHFYKAPVGADRAGPVIPAGSLLARWQAAEPGDEKQRLAAAIEKLLTGGPSPDADPRDSDVVLYRQLASLSGLLSVADWNGAESNASRENTASRDATPVGLDPARFGKHPDGSTIDAASLCVQAPAVIEVRLPAELVAGTEFVTAGSLHPHTGGEGSVQLQVTRTRPKSASGLLLTEVTKDQVAGTWTSDTLQVTHKAPIIVNDDSAARKRFEHAFKDFRRLFPAALCYTKIVPVDEVITLSLFYREDEPLRRLMLNDQQVRRLDRLWEELRFISQDAFMMADAFEQLWQYATQDADPSAFEPLREPVENRVAALQQALAEAEPKHLDALLDFARRAYRRPLTDNEARDLRGLYRELREKNMSHEEAIRLTLARIFVAPAFLYRLEQPPAGTERKPVSDWELASRLSYFLWSSLPDEELRNAAASGRLHEDEVLSRQARRMLKSPRVRRLATEFACQWLNVYSFDQLDQKSSESFPEFAELRGDMHEEVTLFFTDLIQRDGSVLEIFDADHTFLNERLAEFYGIPLEGAKPAAASLGAKGEWFRAEGVQRHGRGGVLGFAATLAKHSGASRSSPILRGVWVSESLLGEELPAPPPGVPPFPEGGAADDLTVREITMLHTSDPACAGCHARIDPFGFALENFDAIGRYREQDRAGRPLDTQSSLPDGTEVEGAADLRDYLVNDRRDAVLDQFCRKLLGYALGREVLLSDQPLLAEMRKRLAENDYRVSMAVETIIQSPQFREIRGRDAEVTH